jgi:hypothetical protein
LKIFKTREFARLTRKTDITDDALREAVERAVKGLVDAELGSGIIKQRVARKGQWPFRRLPDNNRVAGRRSCIFPVLLLEKPSGESHGQ